MWDEETVFLNHAPIEYTKIYFIPYRAATVKDTYEHAQLYFYML